MEMVTIKVLYNLIIAYLPKFVNHFFDWYVSLRQM